MLLLLSYIANLFWLNVNRNHVIIGTQLAHCYLLHFQLAERYQEDAHSPVTVKLTDGLSMSSTPFFKIVISIYLMQCIFIYLFIWCTILSLLYRTVPFWRWVCLQFRRSLHRTLNEKENCHKSVFSSLPSFLEYVNWSSNTLFRDRLCHLHKFFGEKSHSVGWLFVWWDYVDIFNKLSDYVGFNLCLNYFAASPLPHLWICDLISEIPWYTHAALPWIS